MIDTLDNENDIFEAFYIRKNPAYVYLKGNAIYKSMDKSLI